MTATNHSLTGALIGFVIGVPAIALPVAFMSHFVVDSIPHYYTESSGLGSKKYFRIILLDASASILFIALLIFGQRPNWWLAVLCAFAAYSPDLMHIGRYLRARKGLDAHPEKSIWLKFHESVQWFERPIGAAVEFSWFIAMVILLHGFAW